MKSQLLGKMLREVEFPSEPYPGLRPFEQREWPIFFGREKNIAETVDRLVDRQFVALHGDSGCGKSSLIRAGVIPRLESDQARGGGTWLTGSMRPRGAPLNNLASALAGFVPSGVEGSAYLRLRRILNRGSAAAEALHESFGGPGTVSRCLLIDQFEEIFHLAQRGGLEEVRQFVAVIVALQRNPPPEFHIVLTMRSEFIGACARFEGLAETFNATQFLLPAMDRHALQRAITEPARIFGGLVQHAASHPARTDADAW
jgi:energy-coupling factor transporter ATP-binding protein EcfA2